MEGAEDSPSAHDIPHACPDGKWHDGADGCSAFSLAQGQSCARVERDLPEAGHYSWSYSVFCARTLGRSRGRCSNGKTATQEAVMWLREWRCPGGL
jgi:hypothetical protein